MTDYRLRALEGLDFAWDAFDALWKQRLSELANYRDIHGHCNVPTNYRENKSLGTWVRTQKVQYQHKKLGNKSHMTDSRLQALEGLDFVWDASDALWKQRFSELVNYHDIHGHCSVPTNYSENKSLGTWVKTQRVQYKWRGQDDKKSSLTDSRLQALEGLDFAWI
jgi:hypothetical protein